MLKTRFLRPLLLGLASLCLLPVLVVLGLYLYVAPNLPNVAQLRDMRLTTPLQIYTRDGHLLAEFGDERRLPVSYNDVPPLLINAFVAVEDQRYFRHGGVDLMGLARIAITNLATAHDAGASTITMQVARNYFLTRERTLSRKFTEIFLAIRIESQFDKQEIMEMYLNKIHFSHRAYGIASAAQAYYGKTLAELELHEMAMLAGIPKGESTYNPISNPIKALDRRNHVLKRMLAEKYITREQHDAAIAKDVRTTYHGPRIELTAPYLAEMARSHVVTQYGEERAYKDGIKVFLSAPEKLQRAANAAVLKALREYDSRHGWRGAEAKFSEEDLKNPAAVLAQLRRTPDLADLASAVVLNVAAQSITALHKDGSEISIAWEGLSWARRHIDENTLGAAPKTAKEIVGRGDRIRVEQDDKQQWKLAQVPDVSGALVAIDPNNGALLALVGGLDFDISQFNRVIQAKRQPGSNLKPFIYAAAFDKGMTASTLVNDAPIVDEENGEDDTWRPENDSGRYLGPTRLRVALTRSTNTVTIRLFREMGGAYLVDYLSRFGFVRETMEPYASLALGGAIQVSPLELARAYTPFANGGYLVEPYYIDHIESASGEILFATKTKSLCRQCVVNDEAKPDQIPRVLDARNAYIVADIMKDVIHRGTALPTLNQSQSMLLKRTDVGGKTGTTNESRDAWFSGFQQNIVASAWAGFDDHSKPLGNLEYGGRAALPIWQYFMEIALADLPIASDVPPPGVVTAKIDPTTGLLSASGSKGALSELFIAEFAPTETSEVISPSPNNETPANSNDDDAIF